MVTNAGHDALLNDARIRERIVAFLDGKQADVGPLELEAYRFAPMSGASDAHPSLAER